MIQNRAAAAILGLLLIWTTTGSCDSPFGINRHGYQEFRFITIDRVPGAKINWLRIDGCWGEIEASPDVYDFSLLDEIVRLASANDLELVLTVRFDAWHHTPPWMPPWTSVSDPDFFAHYEDFVRELMARYHGKISYYSPANEPNLDIVWDGTRDDYLTLLSIIKDVALEFDPAPKIFGPETVSGTDINYFIGVLEHGCDDLDYIAAHFYPSHPTSAVGDTAAMFNDIEGSGRYLDAINQHCPGKLLWVTEFGVYSDVIGEQEQATEYVEAYRLTVEKEYIDKFFIFTLEDRNAHSPNDYKGYGIVENNEPWPPASYPPDIDNFPPKPSYYAISNFIGGIAEERIVQVDASQPNSVSLLSGSGLPYVSGNPYTGGPDDYNDCEWSPVNDYQGLVGLNVFVSHTGPLDLPTCGTDCDAPGQDFENSDWLGIHLSGLEDGAEYDVYLRFLTIPGHADLRGVRAHIPGTTGWMAFDQNTPEPTVVQKLHGIYDWEEWEVYLGTTTVANGEIAVMFEDTLNDGACRFFESNVTGIRYRSTLRVPSALFHDGFNDGSTDEWSLTCPGDPGCE